MTIRKYEETQNAGLFISLVNDDANGGVDVVLVDQNGKYVNDGCLFSLYKDGIVFHEDIIEKCPILLDKWGQVRIERHTK